MAAHPNQWLRAENGFSPGIHRVCADLATLPRQCYDPNHQPPLVLHIVQNCLNINSQCGQLLHRENCGDLFRFQSELRAGVQFPAPGSPENALSNWTPLYLVRALPDLLRQCQAQGFVPGNQRPSTSRPCTDVSDATWPPLVALKSALNAMAPHYDMTKSGEGLRLIQDAYINLGFNWARRRFRCAYGYGATQSPKILPLEPVA